MTEHRMPPWPSPTTKLSGSKQSRYRPGVLAYFMARMKTSVRLCGFQLDAHQLPYHRCCGEPRYNYGVYDLPGQPVCEYNDLVEIEFQNDRRVWHRLGDYIGRTTTETTRWGTQNVRIYQQRLADRGSGHMLQPAPETWPDAMKMLFTHRRATGKGPNGGPPARTGPDGLVPFLYPKREEHFDTYSLFDGEPDDPENIRKNKRLIATLLRCTLEELDEWLRGESKPSVLFRPFFAEFFPWLNLHNLRDSWREGQDAATLMMERQKAIDSMSPNPGWRAILEFVATNRTALLFAPGSASETLRFQTREGVRDVAREYMRGQLPALDFKTWLAPRLPHVRWDLLAPFTQSTTVVVPAAVEAAAPNQEKQKMAITIKLPSKSRNLPVLRAGDKFFVISDKHDPEMYISTDGPSIVQFSTGIVTPYTDSALPPGEVLLVKDASKLAISYDAT